MSIQNHTASHRFHRGIKTQDKPVSPAYRQRPFQQKLGIAAFPRLYTVLIQQYRPAQYLIRTNT